MPRALVTGSAGFIGFHVAQRLLADGYEVVGYDALTDYYDVSLKEARNALLRQNPDYSFHQAALEDMAALETASEKTFDVIVHLAAQAGVRYSLEAPRKYVESNIIGTFNVMEIARQQGVNHLLMASTSSVYGANTEMPFRETDKVDHQLTIYAASKKANEAMGHTYAHLWNIPTTMFRFFTVYGPWGRPDMAPMKFAGLMAAGKPIDIYNHGEMQRDFTYVDDLVEGIRRLIDTPPVRPASADEIADGDSLSPVAPYRVVNIGNAQPVKLMDFIATLEEAMGHAAPHNFMDMQKGDVTATWADTSLLARLTGFAPDTPLKAGVAALAHWYKQYYRLN